MHTVLLKDYVKITYNKNMLSAQLEWIRDPESYEFRSVYSFLLNFIHKNKIRLFYADIRMERIIYPDDRRWLTDLVLPFANQEGLRKVEVVYFNNIFKAFYVNILAEASKKNKVYLKAIQAQEKILWL